MRKHVYMLQLIKAATQNHSSDNLHCIVNPLNSSNQFPHLTPSVLRSPPRILLVHSLAFIVIEGKRRNVSQTHHLLKPALEFDAGIEKGEETSYSHEWGLTSLTAAYRCPKVSAWASSTGCCFQSTSLRYYRTVCGSRCHSSSYPPSTRWHPQSSTKPKWWHLLCCLAHCSFS